MSLIFVVQFSLYELDGIFFLLNVEEVSKISIELCIFLLV